MASSSYIDLRNTKLNCRVCLGRKADLVSYDSSVFLVNEVTGLMDNMKILDIISLLMPDNKQEKPGYPTGVCCDCLHFVNETLKFKIKLDTSTKILDNLHQSVVQHSKPIEMNSEEKATETKGKVEATVTKGKDRTEIKSNEKATEMKSQDKATETKEEEKATAVKSKTKATKIEYESTEISSEEKDTQPHIEEAAIDLTSLEDEPQPLSITLHHCPICMAQMTALELKEHVQIHATLRKYLDAPNKDELKKNMVFYTLRKEAKPDPKPQPYMCPICREHLSLEQFRLHIKVHKTDTDGKFECKVCRRSFRQMGHLAIHHLKHQQEFPFKCEECGKGFIIERNYKCHILTHKGVLPHKCQDCGKRFANPLHLRRHSVRHTGNGSTYRPVQCKRCLMSFGNRDKLSLHECRLIRARSNGKIKRDRIQCPLCPKTFAGNSGVYLHKMRVHFGRERVALCQVCGISTRNLKLHMMKHNDEKPYKCENCPKRFVTNQVLRRHTMIHTGEKPYMCSMCAKRFNNQYNLQMHERIHIGDKKHVCPICSKGFLEASYLRKHFAVHDLTSVAIKSEECFVISD